MRRREFITLIGGVAATWPLAVRAQTKKRPLVGWLWYSKADIVVGYLEQLMKGMRELGLIEGRDFDMVYTSAEFHVERLPRAAEELVQLKPDLIVAPATLQAVIVIIAADPVESGIVASLARPDRNITGVSLMSAASNAKTVELFRDMLPSVRRVGVLGTAASSVFAKAMDDEVVREAGPIGIEILPIVIINGPDELERAFATMERERADAVVVQGVLAIKPVTDLAIKYRMPTASTTRVFVDIGGLMSFGADGPAAFRHGTKFVQRILEGKQPKDVPIEQPTKFELAINLNTVK
jgi:ABC-type uncharacterized transport system substrate-binding protein